MPYDYIIDPPPSTIAGPEDGTRRNAVRNRITLIVDEHATRRTDGRSGLYPGMEITVAVRIPYHVTARRVDFDPDAIDRHDVDVDRLSYSETDGWQPIEHETYVTVDYGHHAEHTEQLIDDVDDSVDGPASEWLADHAFDSLVDGVFADFDKGVATKPLTTEVVVREKADPADMPTWVDGHHTDPTDAPAYTTAPKTVRIGDAKFRVDGIVPPGDFFDDGGDA